ncbi:uncharacterized protein LOC141849305 [Brevipalpus obovatus]|uniref:uncharacterized protein LOC141849305 n=1 Tax=Brevipalpus obovatus TaxID=246614 RepID=UPI003D9EF317
MMFSCFTSFLVLVFILHFGDNIQGKPILGDSLLDDLCQKVNLLEALGQSKGQVKKFIRNQIIRQTQKSARDGLKEKGKNYDYDDSDSNSLNLESHNMVGQRGHLVQVQLIGTDSAEANSAVELTSSGANNNFESSEISDFAAQIYAVLYTTGRNTGQIGVPGVERRKPQFSRSLTEGNLLSKEECKNLILTIHSELETQKLMMAKSTTNDRELEVSRSNHSDKQNSTSIKTEFGIGPDGYGQSIAHIARGEAALSAAATDNEIQTHGTIKDSKVSFFNLLVPAAIGAK